MECIKPDKNRKAFYRLIATRDLFTFTLVRNWGRIGTRGRLRVDRFDNEADMKQSEGQIVKKRLRHGYCLLK
jgi:predicted DNA-binding WGR domain protein